jgi:hypothetical protein
MTASSFVNVILSNIKKLKGIGTVLRTLVCPAKNILYMTIYKKFKLSSECKYRWLT